MAGTSSLSSFAGDGRGSHGRRGSLERDFVAAWWTLAQAGGHELHESSRLRWFHTGAEA